jgi:hypothetical protein
VRRQLVAGGLAVALASVFALALALRGGREAPPPPQPRPSAPTQTAPPQPKGIPAVAPPWRGAGALVWHEADVDPALLAGQLRAAGFGWVAVFLHDGLKEDPVVSGWIERFVAAGGPVVGGWGVLRDRPEEEAALAASLLELHGLGFYVANAEAAYGASGDPARSGRFVAAFRGRLPELPAALSSQCLPPAGFDLHAWRDAGFAYLPQAYVNQFGDRVQPQACLDAVAGVFGPSSVHPTIGTYGSLHAVSPQTYADLLAAAGTVGFSVYVAEITPGETWAALGRAARELGIAG